MALSSLRHIFTPSTLSVLTHSYKLSSIFFSVLSFSFFVLLAILSYSFFQSYFLSFFVSCWRWWRLFWFNSTTITTLYLIYVSDVVHHRHQSSHSLSSKSCDVINSAQWLSRFTPEQTQENESARRSVRLAAHLFIRSSVFTPHSLQTLTKWASSPPGK